MIKVQNNIDGFVKELDKLCKQARYELANQILNDSNLYVREDTGELRRSSVRGSNLPQGLIGWDTEYAKRVYFTGRPAKDKNPNASLMWVEVARVNHSAEWLEMFRRKLT